MKNRHWLPQLGRFLPILVISLMLLVTGVAKLFSFGDFQDALTASQLIPSGFEGIAGGIFIAAEILIAALVWVPKTRTLALQGTILLCSLLLGYQVWRWYGGIATPCACVGTLYHLSEGQSFGLIGLMMAAGLREVCLSTQIRPRLSRLPAVAVSIVLATSLLYSSKPAAAGDDPGDVELGNCTGRGCDNDNECVAAYKWKWWLGLDRCSWGFRGCQNNINRPCYDIYRMTGKNCTGQVIYPPTRVEEKACR